MSKQDKIIAAMGVVVIVLLAFIAVIMLIRSNGTVSVTPVQETVELAEPQKPVNKEKVTTTESVSDEDATEDTVNPKETVNNKKLEEKYVKSTCKKVKNDDAQLKELYDYWNDYQLEAVNDLIRLDRIRMYTEDLSGTDEFFYFGEVDADLIPEGTGLAIYADDTYYFGEWHKGLREGDGMWLRIYVDGPATEGDYTGVLEHQYSGEFKNDLPNGKGQEHYAVVTERLSSDTSIVNAIGQFEDGYYDGEMYIMTEDTDGNRYDWYATADSGKFEYCVPNKVSTSGKRPVWAKGEDNNHETDDSDDGYYWLSDDDNKGFGIFGLKK